ncbi:MAG: lycopene cyclase domain-containing protein [Chitinophagales bacterium]|nr:lycopene cyclase domain-containing protein [Chitinophagales bacterium]MDW8418485.1 lycopene cyclase domain-containing protein [Chitinophagales bacterium]
MKSVYLFINVFTIAIPLLRSFEPRIYFVSKWKFYLPANFITAMFFLVWDYFKTRYGVWGFNDRYILGVKLFGLPLEEILFFVTVPYACTFIYETVCLFLRGTYIKLSPAKILRSIGFAALLLSPVAFTKAYTFSVLFFGGITFTVFSYLLSNVILEKFIIMYLISVVPMLLVNGLLTGLPVVMYNDAHNLGIRILTMPVEDFAYSAILLLMNVGLYEHFKLRSARCAQGENRMAHTLIKNIV